MKLGTIDQLFYNNLKRKLIEEELDSFGGMESENPINIINILDEYFEQDELDNRDNYKDDCIIFPQTIGNRTFYTKQELIDYVLMQQYEDYGRGNWA